MTGQAAALIDTHLVASDNGASYGENLLNKVIWFGQNLVEHTVAFCSALFGSVSTDVVALGLFGILALMVVLFISALVSVLGSPLTGGMKLVWVVGIFFAAFLGPLVWFIFGRRDAYRRRPAYAYPV